VYLARPDPSRSRPIPLAAAGEIRGQVNDRNQDNTQNGG
jgi:hypothetical protein